MKELINLLSGTDIRGYALPTQTKPEPELDDSTINKIAQGIIDWYESKYGKKLNKISLGRDSRLTGERILNTLAKVFSNNEIEVLDLGLATSPAMFMITQEKNFKPDLSIMITASHMPMNRNGLKILTPEGGLASEDIKTILTNAQTKEPLMYEDQQIETYNYLKDYADHLVSTVRKKTGEIKPLLGSKIIVDAGNGAGGFFATEVLQPLGADITGSNFLEPDGNFPNHIPNPEDKKAIEAISNAVIESNADMGIIFDTDVDRSAIIDEKGEPINKSAFIAFIASLLLQDNPGATIVTDSVTSTGLKDFIEAKGGKHHRFKRGYKNVIDEAKRLNELGENAVLAMETSGHGAVKDNYFLDDGAYLALLSLIAYYQAKKENKSISDLLKDYHYPLEEEELRLNITGDDYKEIGKKFLEDFKKFAQEQSGWKIESPNYEGVRVNCDIDNGNGWILVRQSLHEPVIPINIESDSKEGFNLIKDRFNIFLNSTDLN